MNKGLNKIKNNSNMEEILKEQSFPTWKSGIEHKTYKDTFDVRKKQNSSVSKANNTTYKKTSVMNSMNNLNKTEADNEVNNLIDNMSSKRNPLILFEVNVRDNIQERLEIYEFDHAFRDCDAFCTKYNLPAEKKEFLYKLIEEKINNSSKSSH